MTMKRLIVLAPTRPPSANLASAIADFLVKADHQVVDDQGDRGLFGDLFALGAGWPAAALTRAVDADDADRHAWLRADPAHFRVEPGSVRLMACGDIGQNAEEVSSLLSTLCPLFGEEGFELSAPHPARWYLRPFSGTALPDLPQLPPPEQALGGDLFELWPEDDLHRRWRRLFSEAQIVIAQHPVNQRRMANAKPAINGLWFWGAGTLPRATAVDIDVVHSHDPLLRGLAKAAGLPQADSVEPLAQGNAGLLDLRDPAKNGSDLDWLLGQWQSGVFDRVDWRTPTGRWLWRRWHRFRFWRRALSSPGP